jgi:hemerythrin-like domain-containing protein
MSLMSPISQFLEADHHHCDEQLALAETCAGKHDWQAARTAFAEFDAALRRHLDMEEKILFPAFEETPGTPPGPTAIMRAEHQQIRQIIDSMKQALMAHDAEEFAASTDILHIMMGQHNMKEESVLYPMADRFLGPRAMDLVADMRTMNQLTGAS